MRNDIILVLNLKIRYNKYMYDPYKLEHKTPTKKDYLDTTDFDQSEMLDMVKV